MANFLDNIIPFIQKNALLIIGVIIVVFILIFILNRNRKKELKPINRGEIERIKFIQRMDLNKTTYSDLWRGDEWIGKIQRLCHKNLSAFKKLKDGEKDLDIIEMVFKPSTINLGFFKLAMGKEKCVIIRNINLVRDRARRFIEINETAEFDRYMGIYYDIGVRAEAVEYIAVDTQFRSDMENLGAEYYVESQKNSVIDREGGLKMAIAEKELQTELAKKRGKTSSI